MKSEKGSISMFVIISVLFVTFIIAGMYTGHANKLKVQDEQIGKLQQNYGEYISDESIEKLYKNLEIPESKLIEGLKLNRAIKGESMGEMPSDYNPIKYDYLSTANTDVTEIIFSRGIETEELAGITGVDVSEKQDGSIKLYRASNGDGTYTVHIVSENIICANEDASRTFENMKGVKSIQLDNYTTYDVTSMSYIFRECNALKNIDVSKLYTKNVQSMQSMFYGCYVVEELDVSKFNTAKVVDMGSMFRECRKVTYLDASNFNTALVTDMGGMFTETGISNIDLSNFDTKNVTTMQIMFQNMTNLTEVNISGFTYTSKLVNTSGMFGGCTKLQTIYATENFDCSEMINDTTANSTGMFNNCNSLMGGIATKYSEELSAAGTDEKLIVAAKDATNARIDNTGIAQSINKTWKGYFTDIALKIEANEQILISGDMLNAKMKQLANPSTTGITYNTDDSVITKITFGKWSDTYKTQLGNFTTGTIVDLKQEGTIRMFLNNTQIYILSEYNIVANPYCGYMFSGLKAVTNIEFNNFDTTKTTSMQSLFRYCEKLESIDFSKFTTNKTTDFGSFMNGCKSITTLTNFENIIVTNALDIGGMFANCQNLTVLDLTHFDTAKNKTTNIIFDGCSNLQTIYASEKFVVASELTAYGNTFRGCVKLKGGAGTTYIDQGYTASTSVDDDAYLRIDKGGEAPGYFTKK